MLGCLGAWVLGCLGAWVLGCLGAWVLGCLGVRVLGCADPTLAMLLERRRGSLSQAGEESRLG
ncbi:hypothetical protein D7S86_20980 [Pararobbsia silviterrae]|uniref:Uncharacterized protein n=1 Tax=Pararobbsia silviterrae TaxID=1792498 RepID=A0A494XQE9_9BURK|nr:hypothetical protein D7S86_20980 [Pararobbsia silviterrae]